LRNLPKGEYQIHFKKYSTGFEVYDFTIRIYGQKLVKLIDEEEANTSKVELSNEIIAKIPTIKDHK